MFKVYCSKQHPGRFIAHSPSTGWVIFPDAENGWADRKPARGLDPMHLRQVPALMAAKAMVQTTDTHQAA
jgi:hypothetical protein